MTAPPHALDQLQTPALLIDLDAVRHNIAQMRSHVGGDLDRWRPHVKTAKVPAVLDLLLAAGVRRFKCATTREASVLLQRATPPVDLLVAMPLQGANLARVVELAAAHPRHSLAILSEDPAHAEAVRGAAPRLGIFVDLDPGFRRTGIPLEDRARIAAVARAAGDALRGLHLYEGHVRDADPTARARRCVPLYAELTALAAELAMPGVEVLTSGTPSFPGALAWPGFRGHAHRISPGTVVYWDTTSEEFGITGFRFAVHVLARVISRPDPTRATCDAGSKALDAAAGDPVATVADWPGLVALHPSEEHLPLRVDSGPVPALGTLLRLVPRHVCPTVNLADHAVLLEQGRIAAIVPVAARGHEV